MPEPRAPVPQTPFDPHGGPDGHTGEALLDFSVNSNPFGPPPELLATLSEVEVSTYPDPAARLARAALAEHHALEFERIVMGNGAAELIHRVAAVYLTPGSRVVVAAPSFGEYARASTLYGAEVTEVEVYAGSPAATTLAEAVERYSPTLVWLCHPNNPTGHAWTQEGLAVVAAACEQVDALLCIDAAYLRLSELDVVAPVLPANALHLHSLTKSFCVPGLRVGYAVAPQRVAEALRRIAAPWQASAHAQRAAHWAVSAAGERFLARTVPELLALSGRFRERIRALGVEVGESYTPYFLVEVGSAQGFKAAAGAAGFRVRDASSFGLPRHIRVATRRPADNEQLLAWWAETGVRERG